jgi:class 3 adenylate cyclase
MPLTGPSGFGTSEGNGDHPDHGGGGDGGLFELRLFIEEICCNLCRFRHVHDDGVAPEHVRIDQEVYLGVAGAFADIRVGSPPKVAPYFVEVKWGYPPERIVRTLARKYGPNSGAQQDATHVVLVYETDRVADWPELEAQIRAALRPGLALQVWNERRLIEMLDQEFDLKIDSICASNLLDLRETIDQAKGVDAFGPDYKGTNLGSSLLWHLDFWRLKNIRERQVRERGSFSKREILPPGTYHDVAVIMADLTGFSSYVRDTRDERVVRECLTAFYAKSRHRIIDAGGMLYQFLGDAVIGLFGVPDKPPGYLGEAVDCAASLVEIGASVSNEWQRQIDRVQDAAGVHVGMAIGELQVVSLRPFSRAYIGCIGDSINMSARLMNVAGPGEVVASNMLYQRLDSEQQTGFVSLDPIEAKNVGKIRAWKRAMCDGH